MIPLRVNQLPIRVQTICEKVKNIIQNKVIPCEFELDQWHLDPTTKWKRHPMMVQLRNDAKSQGLWNFFMGCETEVGRKYGAGLNYVQFAFVAEEMGWSLYGQDVFNCQPPQNGNLVRYASASQTQKWFLPILEGKKSSCFAMTEKEVASSDPTNIRSTVQRKGDSYIINGRKWFITDGINPTTDLCITFLKHDTYTEKHYQHSMLLVPMDSPGIKVVGQQSLFGYDNAPQGYAEITFDNVMVPIENRLLGEGQAFKAAQEAFNIGRFCLCSSLIGTAERALSLMKSRVKERVAFGKPLSEQSSIQVEISKSRIEIDQCRLMVLQTAHIMDTQEPKAAKVELSAIKVALPSMACNVIDRAIQAYGGMGVCQDTPLARLYSVACSIRIMDGPDAVHHMVVARNELKSSKI